MCSEFSDFRLDFVAYFALVGPQFQFADNDHSGKWWFLSAKKTDSQQEKHRTATTPTPTAATKRLSISDTAAKERSDSPGDDSPPIDTFRLSIIINR